MSTIDSRIVTMKFDNKQFERAAQTTMSTLGRLTKSLDLGATNKLANVGKNFGKGFNLGGVDSAISGLNSKFLALGTVAVTALSRITNAAIDMGKNLAAQVSGVQGIRDGFAEYELKMGSIQTILANTQRYGTTLQDVTKNLDELNKYADKTIYNFGDMTKNIGLFTNAGIRIEDATSMIKGFSNVAAASGTNAQGAASAAYQLSQALSAGTIRLMDWRSLTNVGMGNKNMQEGLINIATAMGKFEGKADTAKLAAQDFNASLQEKWLGADVMEQYLKIMAGEVTPAQMKAIGLTEEQIDTFTKQAKTAEDAATKVRTFTQLLGTIKEGIGSGWAQTFEIVLGDFNKATKLFSSVSEVVGGYFQRQAEARNKLLKQWAKMGGRDELIQALSNLGKAIANVIKPIHEAFREIFPPMTAQKLYDLTVAFRKFTEGLIISEKTSGKIKEVFLGIFGALKVAKTVVGAAIKYVADFFKILIVGTGQADGLGEAFLSIFEAVSKLTGGFIKWLNQGDRLKNFFDSVIKARNAIFAPLVGTVSNLVQAFAKLITGDVSGFFDKLGDAGDRIKDVFKGLVENLSNFGSGIGGFVSSFASGAIQTIVSIFEKLGEVIKKVFSFDFEMPDFSFIGVAAKGASDQLGKLSGIGSGLGKVFGILIEALGKLGSLFGHVADATGGLFDGLGAIFRFIGRVFDELDFNKLIALVNSGVFAKIGWEMGNLFRSFSKVNDSVADVVNLRGAISGTFDQITSTFKTMQSSLRAKVIKDIAIAIGILVASLIALSFVPEDKLQRSLIALGLIGSMVGALIFALTKFEFPAGLMAVGPAMLGIGGGILLLSLSLQKLQNVDWSTIGKLGLVLAGLAGAVALMGKYGAAGGASILAIGLALTPLVAGLAALSLIDPGTIVKFAFVMGILAAALAGMGAVGPAVLAGGAAMLIAAPGILMITAALAGLQLIDGNAIWKLAGVLGVMAVGLAAMVVALPGAVALTTVAIGLNLLLIPLAVLAKMSFGSVVGAFAKLGVALLVFSAIAGPLSPILLILAGAVGVLGLGLLAAGAGMLLFAAGLALISAAGAGAIAVIQGGFTSLLAMLPTWISMLGDSFVAMAGVIAEAGPAMVQALSAILGSLLQAIIENAPQIGAAFTALLQMFLNVIIENAPLIGQAITAMLQMILNLIIENAPLIMQAGETLITNLLDTMIRVLGEYVPRLAEAAAQAVIDMIEAMANNIGEVVQVGTDLIVNFIGAIADSAAEIAEAGAQAVIELINSIADTIEKHDRELGEAGGRLANALLTGMAEGLAGYVDELLGPIDEMTGWIVNQVGSFLGINSPAKTMIPMGEGLNEGIAVGLGKNLGVITTAAKKTTTHAIKQLSDGLAKAPDFDLDLNASPVITPVLDLTKLSNEASKISGLLNTPVVMTDVSIRDASSLNQEVEETRKPPEDPKNGEQQPSVQLVQNNYSPESLSTIDIYRNTRNQLSMVKEALGIND